MKTIIENLKKQHLVALIPVIILSCLGFVLALVSVILYAKNCGSEFNGNHVSERVISPGVAAAVIAGIVLLVDIAALFLARSPKLARLFALSRLGNYVVFFLMLSAFLFLILDEYSLVGTILYPIVSGGPGDPVDPVLSSYYFASLILGIVACFSSLAAGIVFRKASHRIPEEGEVSSTEVTANE